MHVNEFKRNQTKSLSRAAPGYKQSPEEISSSISSILTWQVCWSSSSKLQLTSDAPGQVTTRRTSSATQNPASATRHTSCSLKIHRQIGAHMASVSQTDVKTAFSCVWTRSSASEITSDRNPDCGRCGSDLLRYYGHLHSGEKVFIYLLDDLKDRQKCALHE